MILSLYIPTTRSVSFETLDLIRVSAVHVAQGYISSNLEFCCPRTLVETDPLHLFVCFGLLMSP